ncbi:Na/Pi cotransporter family protein [Marininema halotolerans]|uniref:Phosphate:Na+ symporter n=1 Tax=Marininema halotolerans TaxID=1155944 RepID=A0A1I6SZM2_9BACL|nr:Na/Pi symporter [Marininema halotolerans]SFS82257.1 phosphate:Na+ symporter [Marininema halotolerans]
MKEIIIPFATGLAIFLFGMQLIRYGLESLAANRLRELLLRFTRTPSRSFATGLIATALLQSSSAVTVITIGFVNAGLMNFAQTVGIILGTNIGTTVTTEILALKVEDFAVPLIILGGALYLMPWKRITHIGMAIGGFGCIFLGMEAMQWIATPLKTRGWITWLLDHSGNDIIVGVLVGMFITAIIQSGGAVIAITMGFFATGIIPLPFAIAVVLGSNAGTCVTGFLASIGSSRGAKQVAVAHLVLNLGGILLFLPLVPWMVNLAPSLSEHPASQVAHIQTLYNVICSLLVLPFASQFASWITKLLPDRTVIAWSAFPRHKKRNSIK